MTHWRTTKGGWRYDVFPLSLDSAEAEVDEFGSLISLWNEKRDGDLLPAWRDFELMDFEEWWGWIAVYDILQGEEYDMRCRLWGTQLAEVHDVEISNRRLRDPDSGMYGKTEMFTQQDVEFFEKVINERLIGLSQGTMDFMNREYIHYKVLRFPLADDRLNIDKFLCGFRLSEPHGM